VLADGSIVTFEQPAHEQLLLELCDSLVPKARDFQAFYFEDIRLSSIDKANTEFGRFKAIF